MKPEQMLHSLKELAEKLDIPVYEQNLRKTVDGVKVKSGLCTVRGKHRFIMDKSIGPREKNVLLASCLVQFSLEHIYVVPAVRDFLKQFSPSGQKFGQGEGDAAGSGLEHTEMTETE